MGIEFILYIGLFAFTSHLLKEFLIKLKFIREWHYPALYAVIYLTILTRITYFILSALTFHEVYSERLVAYKASMMG